MANTVQHENLVQQLVRELNVVDTPNMQIWSENSAAVKMMKNGAGTKRRKFIDIRHH